VVAQLLRCATVIFGMTLLGGVAPLPGFRRNTRK